jgi:3-hydroxyacyl-CoA dehydrogenase
MSELVTFSKEGTIGLITVNNPPVNALAQGVRAGLKEGVEKGLADPDVSAMIIICAGRTFIAGADIREFGKPPLPPGLQEVILAIENSSKPVVAAIHGTALGGGLEVALGCHFRIAAPTRRLVYRSQWDYPGGGGTKLPRVAGVQTALEMIVSGNRLMLSRLCFRS